jgi:hypothetical protein
MIWNLFGDQLVPVLISASLYLILLITVIIQYRRQMQYLDDRDGSPWKK